MIAIAPFHTPIYHIQNNERQPIAAAGCINPLHDLRTLIQKTKDWAIRTTVVALLLLPMMASTSSTNSTERQTITLWRKAKRRTTTTSMLTKTESSAVPKSKNLT